MKKFLSFLVLPACLAGAQLCRAGSHTWSGAVNNAWNNPGNWSSGGAPMFGETNLSLIFPASATRYASTNGVGNFAINSMTIQGNNYSIGGYGITLLYNGVGASILASGTNNEIGLPITLNTSNLGFTIGTGSALTLSGALTGPGSFTKFGRGKLTLAGAFDNTYAGLTKVLGGQLYLNQGDFFNAIAIPGDLVLSDPNNTTIEVDVLYQRDNQVADAAKVTVNQNAYFALQGHSDAISGLVLEGGQVMSDLISPSVAGTLTLFGNVSVLDGAPVDAAIAGHLSLGGATRSFNVTNGAKLYISAQVSDGGASAGITKFGEGTLRLAGASSFSGNVAVNQGVVEVLHNSALGGSAIGGTIIQNGATLRLGGVNVANERLYLNGAGYVPWFNAAPGALEAKTVDATWSGPVTLQSDSTIDVAENVTLTLSGIIDGPGSLTLLDLGTVKLAGGSANTYGGVTLAHGGLLLLGKSGLAAAVPGPMFIAQSNAMANSQLIPKTNVVRLLASQQLNPTAPVHMQASAMLDLNGSSQAIGPLTMVGAIITNTVGTLTLNADVVGESPWNNFPEIYGNISLGGGTRTFTSLTPGAIMLEGPVSDGGRPAGIIKMGPYGLWLSNSNNTYSSITHIKEGWLAAHQPGCLGLPIAGTIVESNANLSIGLDFHGPVETLTLNNGSSLYSVGHNSWDGNIAINGNATIVVSVDTSNETLDINGTIYGDSLTFLLGGTLRFVGNQPNTYTGTTTVLGATTWNTLSTLELSKSNGVVAIPGPLIIGSATNPPAHEVVRLFSNGQIADGVPVTVNASGLLDLNNKSDRIGSLAGSGLVDLKLGALTNGGNNADTTFSGTIAGTSFAAQFFKEGTGALTLTGTNTLSGSMMINNGHLYANGQQQNSSIFVNPNGRLHGRGKVGFITDFGGSTMPGNNWTAPTHGALFSRSLMLDTNSHFNVDLAGVQAGVNYDQLRVTGSVNLAGATLVPTLGFHGAVSNKFTIIDNDDIDPVNEQFKGLKEGATLMIGGAQFQITYTGGDGNDVVLTQLTAAPGPQIGDVDKLGNGSIQIGATGIPNALYNVEATQNLNPPVQWTNIGTATANAQGQLQFTDNDAPNHPMRFYRFVAP